MSRFSFFIALKYLRAKRRNHFISFISLVSIVGITLGVMVLITVLSVMNGFDQEMKSRILGFAPHVTVQSYFGELEGWEGLRTRVAEHRQVETATPYVELQALITRQGATHFALIQGVHPELEASALSLQNYMLQGELASLEAGAFRIILGSRLAAALGVTVGDKVTLVLPEARVNIVGVIPRLKQFEVAGIFEIGYTYDSSMALIHLQDAQVFNRMGGAVSGLNLRVKDLYQAPLVRTELGQSLGPDAYVTDWTLRNGNFFEAVKLEKTLMFLLLFFIVLVAAFNILATLVMLVTEKKSDIAILRTLGARPSQILQIFILQGSCIGLIGTGLGVLLGVLMAMNVTRLVELLETLVGASLMSSDVYFISFLPSEIHVSDVSAVACISLFVSFIFTLYPAWRAANVHITESLRYE